MIWLDETPFHRRIFVYIFSSLAYGISGVSTPGWLQIRVYWILEEQHNTNSLSSPAILSPISQTICIWCSFENSKFYRVYMSSLSVLPPSLAASTSFESFSKHPKCYHVCVGVEKILFRRSFAISVVCLLCKLLNYKDFQNLLLGWVAKRLMTSYI